MLRSTLLRLSESPTARRIATRAPFASSVSHRFVAGDTIPEVVTATRVLNRAGMMATLDYLGESVSSREEATAAADTYIALLDAIHREQLDANVSLKLTAMGQDIDLEFMHDNVERVIRRAAEHDIFVRFDMEGSDYTQPTLDFFRRLWEEGYRGVGPVIQAYLYRSDQDIAWLNSIGARDRLCKGAYKEPATVAYPNKADGDAAYIRLMKQLLDHGTYPGIATHDPAMIDATIAYMKERGYAAERFEFQMLYGVRRDLQRRIVEQGLRLRVYVPFGEAWYPYLMRRMAERPANLFFIAGNIVKEALPGR